MNHFTKKHKAVYDDCRLLSVCSTVGFGILVHLFALTNALHNYDDIITQPSGFGTGISSGRWFLQILGDFTTSLGLSYNLPLPNGLILLVLLGIAAGLLTDSLNIQRKPLAVIIGLLFAVFPATTSTLFFRFTAPYYGLGVLLAVAAAWIPGRCRGSLLLSGLFTALSLGLYQSYTPVTIGLFVLILLQAAFQENADWKKLILRGLYFCAALILGLLFYFLFLKLTLLVMRTELSNYQSINQMGMLSLDQIPHLIKTAYKGLLLLPICDYCGIAATPLARVLYFLLGILSILLTIYILITRVRSVPQGILICLLGGVFPLAVNFVVVMCPDSYIYTLMAYGFILLPCLPIVICEALPARKSLVLPARKLIAVLLASLMLYYAYEANVSYTAMYYHNRNMENYYAALTTQVRMTEGFTSDKNWAFIGNNQDPLRFSFWSDSTRYGGNANTEGLINAYSKHAWMYLYVGYVMPLSTEAEIQELAQTDTVKAMPCWPDNGSIKVIDDTVVIKFEELSH